MEYKKICMLGSFAVGKTALIQQYIHSIFSEDSLSTVGVTISKKLLSLDGKGVGLILWDLEGRNTLGNEDISLLRGASGFFVVADGTRKSTLEAALDLRTRALTLIGAVPHAVLLNKADLTPSWEVTEEDIAALAAQDIRTLHTSAKTAHGVADAFTALARDVASS